ncbi:hypothetical protein TNCV_116171 [Trichonephila clavipes]|nr:hypothetical protein TNCV_116171 [Trichonephila clavipes]
MEYYTKEMDPEFNISQPNVSSGYSHMEYYNKEMNPHVEKKKLSIASEYGQIEPDMHEMNLQFDTNHLTVSSQYSKMEYCSKDMNPQASLNERTVTNAHGNHSLGEINYRQQYNSLKDADLEAPFQNIKITQHNLESIESFNNRETKYTNTKPLQQMDANIFNKPTNMNCKAKLFYLTRHLRSISMIIQWERQKNMTIPDGQ